MTFKKALFSALSATLLVSLSNAQTLQRVSHPADQTFDNLTTSYSLDLSQFLEVPGITGQIVILETDQGNIALEMLANDAPKTVTNFLSYVNDGSYDNSIIHRSVPSFIIQGGGFKSTIPVEDVPDKDPVVNEYKISNTRGTVAMAKLGGDPNSATNGWFINLNNNSENLDNQNGGFTVFAKVIGSGMTVADAIAALPRYNFGSPFNEMPIERVLDSDVTVEDFVTLPSVYEADLFPSANSSPSFVSYSAVSSSNAEVANATIDDIDGNQLTLTLGQGQTGSSDITVTASDPNGNTVELAFTITLEEPYVTLDSDSQEIGFQAENYQLGLDSNTVWQAENVPSWVSLSSSSGDGSEQLTVTVSANEASTPRSATFTINGQSHTIQQRSDFDGWLANYFTATEIAAMTPDVYTADSDGDGVSNLAENTLGLDPSDPNSRIQSHLDFDGSTYTLTYSPYSELVTFQLEKSDNLQAWNELSANPTTIENSLRFELPADSTTQSFYQLVLDSFFFSAPGS
ncbi:peptidylprolyl isomerase [Pelagicoccus sp. NFK12]|uniref:peptidylprolyl isomerase n=1 Tax=Pelagicoccus enzymogenes TaxID=2773457 RepID=A0A927FD05_9BACT|nr:peptidylprolyl isomerase [Pelagicoccus enzymogenes]MBD5781158.1 peptidylprolyl isomerase [Pelagicoccus enzymogenes]